MCIHKKIETYLSLVGSLMSVDRWGRAREVVEVYKGLQDAAAQADKHISHPGVSEWRAEQEADTPT